MRLPKFYVFYTILWISSCEATKNPEVRRNRTLISNNLNDTTEIIDTRFKRESEMDSRLRYNRPIKLPQRAMRKSTAIQPSDPALNSLNLRLNNNKLPRRYITPLVHRKTSNATENKTHEPIEDNNIKNNWTEINEQHEKSSAHDVLSALVKNKENKINKEEEIERDKSGQTESKIKDDKEIKNDTTTPEKEKSKSITTETMSSPLKSVGEDVTENVYVKHKVETTTMPYDNTLVEKSANKPEVITNMDDINSKSKLTNNLSPVELDPKISPLHILAGTGTMLLPKRIPIQSPIIIAPKTIVIANKPDTIRTEKSETNDILVENRENDHKYVNTTNESAGVSLNPKKIEMDEEIVIENNNFEEIYESTVPQYFTPEVITSDPCPGQNWINNQISNPIFTNEQFEDTKCYEETNKPYSYDISRYPDRYIVNTYNERDKKYYDYNNKTPTNYPSNRDYNNYQLQAQNVGQWTPNSYPSNFGFPRRIWRSWINNQIIIRPRTDDVYKTLNGYLGNSQNTPVNNRRNVPTDNTVGTVPTYNIAGNIPVYGANKVTV